VFIADTPDAFRALFADKLQHMLEAAAETGSLGAFILVLANSMQDAELRQRLEKPLNEAFHQLSRNTPDVPPDDTSVFLALRQTGLDAFSTWEARETGSWRLNLNPLRALRPSRASGEAFTGIRKPFNEQAFHFDKAFLEPEVLWRGATTQNLPLTVLYNKFPFAPFHLLVAPEPASHLPQFLTGEHHTAIWRLLEQQAGKLPGLHFTYNSIGAGASVNHLHFQGYVAPALPVENPHWTHNGGNQPWPASCIRMNSACDAWKQIAEWQQENRPFNVLYAPGCCYLLARKAQDQLSVPDRDWGSGAAWAELSGLFTFSDADAFHSVTEEEITNFLSKTRPS